MPRSKIEWTDYTINPIKGKCPVACSYCYARKMYDRFKWNPEIRFDGNALVDFPIKPSRIFVGSTMELFGDWIKPAWMEQIMALPHNFPQHTFIFLTKQPQNLIKFSPFPDNCWVGVTATNNQAYREAIVALAHIEAKIKFISFEPLLENIKIAALNSFINWVIIGACTGQPKELMELQKQYPDLEPMRYGKKLTLQPQLEWVREIVEAADKAGIPVFLKDNLLPLLGGYPIPKMITTKDLTQYMIGIKPANTKDLRLMPNALANIHESYVLLCIPKSQMKKWEQDVDSH